MKKLMEDKGIKFNPENRIEDLTTIENDNMKKIRRIEKKHTKINKIL